MYHLNQGHEGITDSASYVVAVLAATPVKTMVGTPDANLP